MRLRYSSLALLFVAAVPLCAGEPASPQRVVATLKLPFDTIPAGVPFDVEVTLKNTSARPVGAGLAARITLTASDGRAFSPKAYLEMEPQLPSTDNSVELAGGESRDYYVTWYRGVAPWFYNDDAYSGPGTYSVSLELIANAPSPNYAGPIVTNTVRLTRDVAKGEDEAIWDRMQAAAKGHWTDSSFVSTKEGLALLNEIRQAHPTSRYYPYALIMDAQVNNTRIRTAVDIDAALEAAERFTSSPAYGYLLLRGADVAWSIGEGAWWHHDLKTTIEWHTKAAQYYAIVEAKATTLAPRHMANHEGERVRREMERERNQAQ